MLGGGNWMSSMNIHTSISLHKCLNVIPMDMIYHLDDAQGISVTMRNKPFHPKSLFKVNDGCQTLGHRTFGHLSISFCSHLLERA